LKKVIVTGANGFIGEALLKELSKKELNIIAVVRNCKSDVSKIDKLSGVRIVYCAMEDIQNLPNIIPDRDIDTCFHLAWCGSFGEKRANYEIQMHNIDYAMHTVDAIAKMGVKRFIGAGTLAEKDVLNYHMTDGATPNAVSCYGIAKMTAHFMTKVKCTQLGIEHVWCYLTNTYAVGSTTNNFVLMASRLMLSGAKASFTSGEQTYDFMYVTDTVRAMFYAADKGKTNTAYYLGSNRPRKLKEYIQIIRDTIDPSIKLYLGELPFNGIPLPPEAYNSKKLEIDTGFWPEIEFEQGIRWTVEWLKETEFSNSNG
jgi:UDP-glucose 4-epimerase